MPTKLETGAGTFQTLAQHSCHHGQGRRALSWMPEPTAAPVASNFAEYPKYELRAPSTAFSIGWRRNGSNCDLHNGKRNPLGKVVRETERIWRRYHLTYVQAVDVGKHGRNRLELERD